MSLSGTHPESDSPTARYAYTAILVALVVAGLVQRLRRAWEDMPDLVVTTLPDDSFYYFQIARNIMHGRNVTLDGETVTNGFHPLWMGLILPIFALDDRHLSVHLALTLGAVLGAATIVLVFAVTRQLTGTPRAGLLAAGFFALHPALVIYAVNGLETSIMMFMLAIVTLLFVRLAMGGARSTAALAGLGVASGFMILARIDTALALPAMMLWFAIADRTRNWWRAPLLIGGAAAVVLAPWLLWNLLTFGRLLQDSAIAGDVLIRESFLRANGDSLGVRLEHGMRETRQYIFEWGPIQFMVPWRDSVRPFWIIVAAVVAAVTLTPTRHRRQVLVAAGLLAVPFGGLVAALLYETMFRWFVRTWYFAPYAVLAAVCAGLVAHWIEGVALDARDWALPRFATAGAAARQRSGIVVTALVYAIAAAGVLWMYGPHRADALVFGYYWQPEVMEATQWIATETPQGSRVAAYNAGIPSYFGERVVVNLDGVVNYDAFVAARDCTTRDYIRERRIDFVVDSYGQFLLAACGLALEKDVRTIEVFDGPSPVHATVPVAP